MKTKSVAEKGRPTHPKKKKHKRTGLTPEEAFEKEYFPKKQKPKHGVSSSCKLDIILGKNVEYFKIAVHQDYAAGPQTDYDEDDDGSQESKKYSLHLFWPKAVNICFQEMTIIIEETQIAGGYAHSGL